MAFFDPLPPHWVFFTMYIQQFLTSLHLPPPSTETTYLGHLGILNIESEFYQICFFWNLWKGWIFYVFNKFLKLILRLNQLVWLPTKISKINLKISSNFVAFFSDFRIQIKYISMSKNVWKFGEKIVSFTCSTDFLKRPFKFVEIFQLIWRLITK